jgi:dTDP-3-amino-3,4,6-trideoxy-alpha-D-glucose transaminase
LFPALIEPARKANFMAYLERNGIACGQHYPVPIPDQEALAHVEHELAGDYPAAKRIASSEVSLPIHPYLTDEEVARVIEVCNAVC